MTHIVLQKKMPTVGNHTYSKVARSGDVVGAIGLSFVEDK